MSDTSDTSSTTGAPSINKILGQLAQKTKQQDIQLFQRKTVYENATKPVVDKNNNNKKPEVKAPEPEDKFDYDYVIVQEGPAASQNHKQQQQEQDDMYENEDTTPQVYYLDNDRGTKPSSTLTRGGLPPVPNDVSNHEQNLKTPTATMKKTTPASSVKTSGNVGGWKAMTLPPQNKASTPDDIYENEDEKANNSSPNKPVGSGGGLKAATLSRNQDSNPADIYLNEEDEKKPRSFSSGVTKATPPWEKNKMKEIPKTEKLPIEKCEKKKEPEIPSDDELYDQLNYVEMDIKKNQKMAAVKSGSSSMNDVKSTAKAAAGKFFRMGGSGDKDEEKEKKKEKEKTASSTVTLPPLPDRRPSTAVEVGKKNNSEDEEEYEYPDPVEFGVSQRKQSQNLGSPTSVNSSSSIGSSDEKKSSAASAAAAKIGNWGANQIKKIKELGRDSKDVSSEAGKQNRWHDVSEISKDVDVTSFTVGEVVECLQHLHLGKYAKAFTKSQVDGTFLMNLDESMLARSFKMNTLDVRKLIMFAKDKWRPSI